MITLNSFLMDTAITLLFMTIILGGLGILGIIRALKGKIVFSKKALFEKAEEYTPLQLLLYSLLFLTTSLWYNFYLGYMFEYIEKAQILVNNFDSKLNFSGFYPIFGVIFLSIIIFGGNFSTSYADKKNDMYILEFNKYDKVGGFFSFLLLFLPLYKPFSWTTINYHWIFVILIILLGFSAFLITIQTKILFNNEYIVFHTFWRPKRTVLWKDVKSIRFEEKSNEYIRLTTKDNKKFIIPARFNGLVSFMSTFKIRNKK